MYVCYTNITLHVAFGIIRGRSWNILPVDTGALLYNRLSAVLVKEPTIVFDWPPLGVTLTVQGLLVNGLNI
jgi:hypothetical protein